MCTGRCTYAAVPTFKSINDRPHDYNASTGEDVVFHCNAYAIPEASVVWYKNGDPLDRMYSSCSAIRSCDHCSSFALHCNNQQRRFYFHMT